IVGGDRTAHDATLTGAAVMRSDDDREGPDAEQPRSSEIVVGQHEPPNLTAVSVEIDVRERTESEAFLGVNSPSERIEIPFDDPLLVTAGRFDQRVRSRNGDGIMADSPCRRPRNDPL